jgi:flagellar biosynthetic protein FliQ
MNQGDVLDLGRQAMQVAVSISLPILGLTLLAGLAVAIFQAVTQVQEMTLTYIPKMLAVVLAFVLFGSWMISTIVNFTSQSFNAIQNVTK